ncbi:hypothetical protein [Leifsonia sp. AG29]|uniref:hypothetical protein n=1 Tax=Leifsonia sp. AG29 TaxID=2598860 RepID=UPI00131C8E7D|nr:hypothetical protein [Leifsonia sp. AG29]
MAGEESVARRRAVLLWSGIGVLLLVAFAAAFGAVQRTYYSASGFVTAYVGALAAHDLPSALSMPGAAPTAASLTASGLPANASRELLRSDVLPELSDVSVLSDRTEPTGAHTVTVRVLSDGQPVTATFSVKRSGSVLGFLPTWAFATSPLTVAHVTVAHADAFTLGAHTLQPRAAAPDQPADAFTVSADYVMPAPARYRFTHRSAMLAAAPAVLEARPGKVTETTVDAEPTPAFTGEVDKQLRGFLDACVKQTVLQPAGCPMGAQIDDRVQGDPHWSMVSYPPVHLAAGPTGWVMPQTVGVAHLSASVQSLFDGTVSQRESDEQFAVSLTSVVIRPDGSLDIIVGD